MRRLAITMTSLALVLTACAGSDDAEVGSTSPDDTTQTEDAGEDADTTDDPATSGEDDATSDGDDDATEGDAADDEATEDDAEADPEADAAAEPDPAQLEDPCADHQDREGEAFLELVAPVDEQTVTDELELVGCASVPEGTVQYRLLDGDGATLDEGFTTAECGGPCIGEFRETIPLDSAEGEPVVHVQAFWEDLSDGSERGLVERVVVLE